MQHQVDAAVWRRAADFLDDVALPAVRLADDPLEVLPRQRPQALKPGLVVEQATPVVGVERRDAGNDHER